MTQQIHPCNQPILSRVGH